MKITVKRSGGFAGLTENLADVDTSQLSPDAASKVSANVSSVEFFDYPAEVSGGTVGADMYRYEITIADGPRRHTVAFGESAPEAKALMELVQSLEAVK